MFEVFRVSSSGMEAQRLRMNVIASNLANADTTRSADGTGAYRRKDVIFAAEHGGDFSGVLNASVNESNYNNGVRVASVTEDQRPFKYAYEPTHPDADKNGYVAFPNVNVSEEMVNMISASRSYEANVQAFKASKDMANKALDLAT